MPQIFKALASITAWALFIIGWVTGLSTLIGGVIGGHLYSGTGAAPPLVYPVFFAVAIASLVLAVVVMLLRKKME
ncbi:hypothetical protein ACFLUD_01805 [Chloroflexota bacterium]